MLTTFVFLQEGNIKNPEKSMEITNIEEENLSLYLLNDLMNFNVILRKYVAYNNIRSHKIAGFIVSVENAFLEKSQGECQIETHKAT